MAKIVKKLPYVLYGNINNSSRCNTAGQQKKGLEMKRLLVVLMAMIFAGLAVSAQAANITFYPGSVALNIEPGKSAAANLAIYADNRNPYTIALDVADGDDIKGWLNPTTFKMSGSTSLSLNVTVPAGTKGRTYTALVIPRAQEPATEQMGGGGFTVVVEVPSLKNCADVPDFVNVQVGPENIRAPKRKKVDIDISGKVVVSPNCEIKEGTYSIEIDDGQVAGDLAIDAKGNFDQKISLMVSKQGIAKEGKTYNGKLTVVDADGNSATQKFFVKVAHDQGKKKGLNKN